MAYISASYYDTGSYISGTTDSFSYGSAYTIKYAPSTFIYSASVVTGTVENYKNGTAYTIKYAQPTTLYSGGIILNAGTTIITVAIAGSSSHGSRPAKL